MRGLEKICKLSKFVNIISQIAVWQSTLSSVVNLTLIFEIVFTLLTQSEIKFLFTFFSNRADTSKITRHSDGIWNLRNMYDLKEAPEEAWIKVRVKLAMLTYKYSQINKANRFCKFCIIVTHGDFVNVVGLKLDNRWMGVATKLTSWQTGSWYITMTMNLKHIYVWWFLKSNPM